MLTQSQYERLCRAVNDNQAPKAEDVADLLESFEDLYLALDRVAMRGSKAIQQTEMDLLSDDNGEPVVRLGRVGR